MIKYLLLFFYSSLLFAADALPDAPRPVIESIPWWMYLLLFVGIIGGGLFALWKHNPTEALKVKDATIADLKASNDKLHQLLTSAQGIMARHAATINTQAETLNKATVTSITPPAAPAKQAPTGFVLPTK